MIYICLIFFTKIVSKICPKYDGIKSIFDRPSAETPGISGYYNKQIRLGDVTLNSNTGDELYNLKCTVYNTSGTYQGYFCTAPSGAKNYMPKQWWMRAPSDTTLLDWSKSQATYADWWNTDKRYLDSGGQMNYGCFNSATFTNIYKSFRYGMFGTDNTTKSTLAKYLPDPSLPDSFCMDYTGSTETTWVDGKFIEVKFSHLAQGGRTDDGTPQNIDLDARLQFPLLPQGYLKDQTSHLFKFKGQWLKVGDGLPINDGFDSDGYCQISFDFGTKELLNLNQKDNKIYIDVKNKNFNDTTGTYLNGYGDLVDPDTTSMSQVSMNHFACDSASGKAKITVPVKKDEELWIRIAPYSSEMGHFAYMDNLSCTYFR